MNTLDCEKLSIYCHKGYRFIGTTPSHLLSILNKAPRDNCVDYAKYVITALFDLMDARYYKDSTDIRMTIIDSLVSEFLLSWMEHDTTAAQSLSSFCRYRVENGKHNYCYRYLSKDEIDKIHSDKVAKWTEEKKTAKQKGYTFTKQKPKKKEGYVDHQMLRAMRREHLLSLGREGFNYQQAKAEGRPLNYSCLTPKQSSSQINYLELWKLSECYSSVEGSDDVVGTSNAMRLSELLLEMKKPLQVTHKKGQNRFDEMRKGYMAYYQCCQRLTPKSQANLNLNDKEYVVACLNLYGLEQNYRFHLAALLALRIAEKHEKHNKDFFIKEKWEITNNLWARSNDVFGTEIIQFPNGTNCELHSYDIFHYEPQIQCFFQPLLWDCELGEKYLATLFFSQSIMTVLVWYYNSVKKEEWLWPLKPTDYHKMRLFFENEFKVFSLYQQIFAEDISESHVHNKFTDDVCEYIIDYFDFWDHNPSPDIVPSPGRTEMQNHMKLVRENNR